MACIARLSLSLRIHAFPRFFFKEKSCPWPLLRYFPWPKVTTAWDIFQVAWLLHILVPVHVSSYDSEFIKIGVGIVDHASGSLWIHKSGSMPYISPLFTIFIPFFGLTWFLLNLRNQSSSSVIYKAMLQPYKFDLFTCINPCLSYA